jgi:hypothetical protein
VVVASDHCTYRKVEPIMPRFSYGDEAPEGFDFEEGAVYEGQVAAIDVVEGKYSKYPILTLKQENGDTLRLPCYHAVLAREVEDRNVEVGDYFGAKYFGKGARYHVWEAHNDKGQQHLPADGDGSWT